jgi:hypothetical protein
MLAVEPAMRKQDEELQAACSAAARSGGRVGGDVAAGCATTVSQHCFEMFGFDVLIDEGLLPWLIEVNTSPSVECTSPLDMAIKTRVMADLLNIVGVTCGYNPTGAATAYVPDEATYALSALTTARASLEADLAQFSDKRRLCEGPDGSSRGVALTDAECNTIRAFEAELWRSKATGAKSIYPVRETVGQYRQHWEGL